MLKLLPPVCRDCGKAAEKKAKLSPYLDFRLCADCIARREREVLRAEKPRRKPPSKKSQREIARVGRKKPRSKAAGDARGRKRGK